MVNYKDKYAQVVREFGPDEARKLRYIIETSNKDMIDGDKRYQRIMN